MENEILDRKIIKSIIAFVIAIITALLLTICTIIFNINFAIKPHKINIEKASAVVADDYSEKIYVGDLSGNVVAYDSNWEVVFEWKNPEQNPIFKILPFDENTIFVSCENGFVYKVVNAKTVSSYKANVGVAQMDFSKDHLYLATNNMSQNRLLIYKLDFELNLIAMQISNQVIPLAGFAVKEDDSMLIVSDVFFNVFLFNTENIASTIPGIMEGNEIDIFISDGAPIAVEYDKKKDIIYLLTKDNLQAIYFNSSINTFEIVFEPLIFKNLPKKFSYDNKNSKLFISFQLYSDVWVVDAQTGELDISFPSFFDINEISYSISQNQLLVMHQVKEGNNLFNVIDSYEGTILGSIKIINIFQVILSIFTFLSIFATIILFCNAFLPKFIAKVKKNFFNFKAYKSWKVFYIIIPSFILMFTFVYYPIFGSLGYAFMDYRIGYPLKFIGFENFNVIFQDSQFFLAIRNMFIFLIADLIKGIIPAFIYAQLIIHLKPKTTQYWVRMLLFLPGILPGAAGILIWNTAILNKNGGLLNQILGTDFSWLSDIRVNMVALNLFGFPFIGSYLIYYGALMAVSDSYYDAAKLDGCPLWKRILFIDIPFVTPQIKYLFVIGFIGSVQNIGTLLMTTQGAYDTITPIYMMYQNINVNQYGIASAWALMVFIFLAGVTIFNLKLKTVDFN